MLFFLGIFRLGLNQSVRSLKTCRAKIGSMTDFSWIGSPKKLHLGSLLIQTWPTSPHKGRPRSARRSMQLDVLRAPIKGELTGKERPGSRGRQPVSSTHHPVSRSSSQSAGIFIQSAEVSRGRQLRPIQETKQVYLMIARKRRGTVQYDVTAV